jgi:HPt (histidine-containing phosphotransfer) domain-containing protein
VIDPDVIDALLDAVDGDREFLGELIETWLDDAPRQLALIEAAAADGDAGDLVTPAHTLKSTSASLGAMEVAELARVMEHQARTGTPADPETVTRLRTSILGASDGLRAIAAHGREDGSG